MLEFVVIYSGLKMAQHSSMEITKGSYLRSRLKGFAGGPCPGMKLDVSCVWGYNVFRKQGLKNAATFCRVSTLNCVGFGVSQDGISVRPMARARQGYMLTLHWQDFQSSTGRASNFARSFCCY